MSAILLCGAVAMCAALSARAESKCAKSDYDDTQHRFCIHLEPGWQLAPLPGDTQGMVFKKVVDGVPGVLRVSVRALKGSETAKAVLDGEEAGAKDELGYKRGVEVPESVGSMSAVKRTFSVFANGDKDTVRAIEVYALPAFGFVHVLHFETLDKKRGGFTRDLDRMMSSYVPLAGKGTYATLVGTWINTGGGPDLVLDEDGRFQLGPLKGGYTADGGKLLICPGAQCEGYHYTLDGTALSLSSPNLGDDMKFKRSGAQRVHVDEAAAKRSGPLSREELIGSWRVIDAANTDVLHLQLAPTGSVSFGQLSGQWHYSTGRLTIRSNAGVEITYAASMNDGKLTLGGGDLDRDLTLLRE
jgi:hypothetical protein